MKGSENTSLDELVREFDEIQAQKSAVDDPTNNFQLVLDRLRQWRDKTKRRLESEFSTDEAQKFTKAGALNNAQFGDYATLFEEGQRYRSALARLASRRPALPSHVEGPGVSSRQDSAADPTISANQISQVSVPFASPGTPPLKESFFRKRRVSLITAAALAVLVAIGIRVVPLVRTALLNRVSPVVVPDPHFVGIQTS